MEGSAGAETFLTVAEVAELLKLNQQTVRNWIDHGTLPAHRVGRRVRIRQSDLDRLLESGSTVGGGAAGPSADDFWGGMPVGRAEVDPDADADPEADAEAGPLAGAEPIDADADRADAERGDG